MSRHRWLLLALAASVLAAALAGCGQDQRAAWTFNVSALQADHKVWFADAAMEYNAAAEAFLFDVTETRGDPVQYFTPHPLSGWKAWRDCTGGTRCSITFSTRWDWTVCTNGAGESDFITAALHELGHYVFGPGHNSNPQSIMQEQLPNCTRLSEYDRQQLRVGQ